MLQSGPIRVVPAPAHQQYHLSSPQSDTSAVVTPTNRSDTPASHQTSSSGNDSVGLPLSGEVMRVSARKECLNPVALTLLHNDAEDSIQEDLYYLNLADTANYNRSAASSREASPSTIPVTVSADPPLLLDVPRPRAIRPLPLPPPRMFTTKQS
jgi:hypothetical protein